MTQLNYKEVIPDEITDATYLYNGEHWPIPSIKQLEQWSFWGYTTTPDGRKVEPDYEEGWLCILGYI